MKKGFLLIMAITFMTATSQPLDGAESARTIKATIQKKIQPAAPLGIVNSSLLDRPSLTAEDMERVAALRAIFDLSDESDYYVRAAWTALAYNPSRTLRDAAQIAGWIQKRKTDPTAFSQGFSTIFSNNYKAIMGTGNPCVVWGEDFIAPLIEDGNCANVSGSEFWILGKGDPTELMKGAGFGRTDYFQMCNAMTGEPFQPTGGKGGLEVAKGLITASGTTMKGGPAEAGAKSINWLEQANGSGGQDLPGSLGELTLFTNCGPSSLSQRGESDQCAERKEGNMPSSHLGGSLMEGGGWWDSWCLTSSCEQEKKRKENERKEREKTETDYRSLSEDRFQKDVDKAKEDVRTAREALNAAQKEEKEANQREGYGSRAAQEDAKKKREEKEKALKAAEEKLAAAEKAKKEAAKKKEEETKTAKAKEAEEKAKCQGSNCPSDCVMDVNGCYGNIPKDFQAQAEKELNDILNLICSTLMPCAQIDKDFLVKIKSYPKEGPMVGGEGSHGLSLAERLTGPQENPSPAMVLGLDACGHMRQYNCMESMPDPTGFDPCTPGPRVTPGSDGTGPRPLPVDGPVDRSIFEAGRLQLQNNANPAIQRETLRRNERNEIIE